jgi:nucleotide-binding universal stress UspA family protein
MIRFNRILYPVDLSRQSREAVPFVAAMAARFSSELFILHVLEPHLSYYPIPAAATPAAMQHDTQAHTARHTEFQSFVSELFSNISVRPLPSEGDVLDPLGDSPFDVAREKLEALQAEAGTKVDIKLALGPCSQVVRNAALEHQDLVLIGRGVIQEGLGQLRRSVFDIIRDSPCHVISVSR